MRIRNLLRVLHAVSTFSDGGCCDFQDCLSREERAPVLRSQRMLAGYDFFWVSLERLFWLAEGVQFVRQLLAI